MCALLEVRACTGLVLRSGIVCVCCQEDVGESRVQGLIARAWRCSPLLQLRSLPFVSPNNCLFARLKLCGSQNGVHWSISACAVRLRGGFHDSVLECGITPPHLADQDSLCTIPRTAVREDLSRLVSVVWLCQYFSVVNSDNAWCFPVMSS
jgi:hypothetical protein